MKGKMYKLTGTGLFGNTPRGKFKPGKEPIPLRRQDKASDHIAQPPGLSIPLPDKLRGK